MDAGSGIPTDGLAMSFHFPQERYINPQELRTLFDHTQGVVLSQVSVLCRLQPTTIQNWIKRGLVPSPVRKRYDLRTVSRILLVALLHNCLPLGHIAFLLACINGETEEREDDLLPEDELYQLLYLAIVYTEDNEISTSFGDTREMQSRLSQLLPIQHLDAVVQHRVVPILAVMLIAYVSVEQQKRAMMAIEHLREEYPDVASSFVKGESCLRSSVADVRKAPGKESGESHKMP